MSLQSQLFRGDPKLEAAAVSDPAHVVPGAVGNHVGKIQQALITLDRAVIDQLEVIETRYGPSTASAVLAYKTKRGIINRAYQIKPDNIVGKMTMASLDSEMLNVEASASSTPPVEGARQAGWQWCNKCQGLAFSLNQPSVCPAGGSHDQTGSGNYTLAVEDPSAQGQPDWRWCNKCQGLAFSLSEPSVCPAGGSHDHRDSGNYTLAHNDPSAQGQSDWRWCSKCQGLAFSLNQPSVCPAGGSHDHSQSGNYTLASVEDVTSGESFAFDDTATGGAEGSSGFVPANTSQPTTQGVSWVDPQRTDWLIGQIFFDTRVDQPDFAALAELDKFSAYTPVFNDPLSPPLPFQFIGFADHRSMPGGNLALTGRRANNTLARVDVVLTNGRVSHADPPQVRQKARPTKFKPMAQGVGVDLHSKTGQSLESLRFWRRVDIYGPPAVIAGFRLPGSRGTSPPPTSTDFVATIQVSAGGGGVVGVDFFQLRIDDKKNARTRFFDYRGVGVGLSLPVSFDVSSSSPFPFSTSPTPVALEDFEGPANHAQLGVMLPVVTTADAVVMLGPNMNRKAPIVVLRYAGIKLIPTGIPSIGISVSIGALHP